MSPNLDPRDRLQRRAILLLLIMAGIGSAMATLMHRFEATPRTIDLVIPPLLTLLFLFGFVTLYRRPQSLRWILPATFLVGFAGIVVPAWFHTLQASLHPDIQLVAILPPIAPVVMPLLGGVMLFLRPSAVLFSGVLAWLVIAGPILLYLLLNPEEIATPRGRDLIVGLGPAMGVMLLILYLHVDMNRRLGAVQLVVDRLTSETHRDPQTGLLDRRGGELILRQMLARIDPRGGAILFRLDTGFERALVVAGSPADEVLVSLVQRCERLLRRQDIFIRWDTDCFLLLIDDADIRDCEVMAEHLRQIIVSKAFAEVGFITASFGVTELLEDEGIEELLERTQAALTAARAAGGNIVETA